MKNKIIKDALALTLITLVAGVALGGVYEITKDPIAKQEAQAKAEAYEQVFTDAAAFEAVEMDDTLTKTIRDQLDQEGYKAQSIEEVMRAEDQSGETLGYAFTVVVSPIPIPLMADVVIASVGHIPSISTKVGFSLMIPLYKRSRGEFAFITDLPLPSHEMHKDRH